MSLVQGLASVMLGPDAGHLTDYTCAIRVFQINERRNTVIKAPSFGSPALEERAAAGQATVTIEFISEFVASSGLWVEFLNAMATDSAELYFEWTPNDDTVSATNPKRTGFIVVSDLDSGAPAYEARRQAKTFPARSISALIVA